MVIYSPRQHHRHHRNDHHRSEENCYQHTAFITMSEPIPIGVGAKITMIGAYPAAVFAGYLWSVLPLFHFS